MKNKIAIFAAVVGVVWLALHSPLIEADVGTLAVAVFLGILCLVPSIIWIASGMNWVPLFELYALVHLGYYWMPSISAESVLWKVPEGLRIPILLAVCVYLSAGALVYYAMLRRVKRRGLSAGSLWNRTLEGKNSVLMFWIGMWIWLGYYILSHSGFLPDLGTFSGLFRAVATIGGTLGIFSFSARMGAGTFLGPPRNMFLVLLVAGIILQFASGFLVTGAFVVCTALFGYAVGAKRIPIVTTAVAIALIAFLNLGKAEMRREYWPEETQGIQAGENIIKLYSFWIDASWDRLLHGEEEQEDQGNLAKRANLLRMLGLTMVESPHELPFLHGQTYRQSLPLFVPRFIWKNRPQIHVAQANVGIYYGVLDENSVELTMISFGQIAEGWMNFGWWGLAAAGAFAGLFFGLGLSVAYGRPMTSVGFFFGLVFSNYAVNLEHFWGPILMSFYQTALLALIFLYVLSKPPVKSEPDSALPPETPH